MNFLKTIPMVLLVVAACGKGGDKKASGKAASGPAGGPACEVAAAGYVKYHAEGGGNWIAGLKPSADEIKVLVAKFTADCTTRNWSEKIKTCMATTVPKMGENCGEDINVKQLVHDAAGEIEAARTAAGSAAGSAAAGSADGSAAAGSAAAGSADGSAAAGSADGSAAAGSAK